MKIIKCTIISLTVVHNFRVLVGFKESGVVPKILAQAVPAATA